MIHDDDFRHEAKQFPITHRVFHGMLRVFGISQENVKIMYVGVLIDGPKWSEVDPGQT